MTNFTSRIFQSSLSSIAAQQAAMASISQNIANVNTEGYARRTAEMQTRTSAGSGGSGLSIGSGVEVARVNRVQDQFLDEVVRGATNESFQYATERDLLTRIENYFSLNGDASVVGEELSRFYAAMDDLSVDPASLELRTALLERATDLVTSINTTFTGLENLQYEIDRRIEAEIQSVNELTSSIAQLNQQVASRENSGNVAADERDRRDVLLGELSQLMSFNMVEASDGSVSISLANGFTLVNGSTSRELETTRSPSFDTTPAVGLNGGALNYVVYDFDTTGVPGAEAHIDLNATLASGSGSLAGLLNTRGYPGSNAETGPFLSQGTIPEIAASIEAIARGLVVDFNNVYANQDTSDADPANHVNGNFDLDGNRAGSGGTPAYFFSLSGVTMQGAGGLDDAGSVGGADEGFGRILESDLTALLREGGGTTLTSVAAALQVAVTDARDIAISDVATEEQNGTGLTYLAQLQNGDAGDAITMTNATYTLASRNVSSGGTATFTFDSNLNDIYGAAVGKVGNAAARAQLNSDISNDNLVSVQSRRDALAGVSLDEEFTKLVQFQQAFEANARVLRTANELIDTILQAI